MEGGFKSSLDQLAGKRRTYEDLSRFVGARSSGVANYSLLLGAGSSVSSNVRSASQLVEQWRRDVFSRLRPDQPYEAETAIDYLTKNEAVWYNAQREYSSLFEKNFDLPRQRRMFVEQEVAGKSPNLGYAYLVRLIEDGFLNTVFTTNFDDLVNEAFFQFSQTRPLVCAHDSSISSVAVTSKRPKIIKLHGDYLFDDIKATVRETESLEDNIRKKFIEFGRDFGLIVVGYGGYDRSIMDVLQYLLRSEDYFKHGIYWCLRKGDAPSDELLKLLWRDRVYFVEVDGFDELFASLHNDLIGSSLPIDSGVVTNKPKAIIQGFCENKFLMDSSSQLIKRDLERLRRQSEREELFSFLRDTKDDATDSEKRSAESLNERELVITLEVKQLLNSGDFDLAREKVKNSLEARPSKKLKEELSELRVRVEELAGDLSAAIAAVDSLIADDPLDPENYIRKTFLTIDTDERLRILDVAVEIDPDNFRVFGRRADCLIQVYESGAATDRVDVLKKIELDLERSLELEPGFRNPALSASLDFYSNSSISKDDIKSKLDSIVSHCMRFGARRTFTLRARLKRLSKYKEDRSSVQADQLVKDILNAKLASSKTIQPYYEWLELDAYALLERKEDLSRRLSELALNQELSGTREYLRRKADFLTKFNGDMQGAVSSLKLAVKADATRSDIFRLSTILELIGDSEGISKLISDNSARLPLVDRIGLRRSECVARDATEDALAHLRSQFSKQFVGALDRINEIHDLLLLSRYAEAASIGKAILESAKWDKVQFGEHIVNYEMAQQRLGQQINKKRLADVAEVTSSESVRGCVYYLLGDLTKAKDAFVSLIREDKEERYSVAKWALFNDERGRAFFDGVVKVAMN